MNITWDNDKKKTNISDLAFKDLISDPTELSSLNVDDKDFILTSFNAKMYNYVVEYVYNKSVKKLQDSIFRLGDELIVNLIHWIDRTFISNFFDIFVLRLACDINFISKEEKLVILQIIEYLQGKKDSFSDTEDINKEKTKYFIVYLYESILKRDFDKVINRINQIIDALQTNQITVDDASYKEMLEVTNKHKNILLRLIFAMVKVEISKDNNKRLKTLSQNMSNLIVDLWERTSLNDKKFYSYYLKTLPTDSSVYKVLSVVLGKVKLIDFTTDINIVTDILKNCQSILSCHYSVNNQKDETEGLIRLHEIEVYPRYFLRSVITPCVVTYLGGNNGYIGTSREISSQILDEITTEKWLYYFKNFFYQDDFILTTLINVPVSLKDWCVIIKKSGVSEEDIEDADIKELIKYSKQQNFDEIKRLAEKIYYKD